MSAIVMRPTQPIPGTHRGARTKASETLEPIPSRIRATDVSRAALDDTCLRGIVLVFDTCDVAGLTACARKKREAASKKRHQNALLQSILVCGGVAVVRADTPFSSAMEHKFGRLTSV